MKRLLASAFFILLFWALFVPALEYPDEQAHFATVSLLSEKGKMPAGNQADVSLELETAQRILGTLRNQRGINKLTYHPEYKIEYSDNNLYGPQEHTISQANNSTIRSTYRIKEAARYPFLYYVYESIFYRIVTNYPLFTRLFFARLGSVLLGVINVWVAFKIGKELFDKEKKAILLGSLVALQPMMTFVMSGVNSDVLHNLLFSLIILFLIKFIKYEFVGDIAFYLGLFIGLDFLTKPQAYIAIPMIFFAFIIRIIEKRQLKSSIRSMLLIGIVASIFGYFTQKDQILNLFKEGEIPYQSSAKNINAPSFIEHAKYSFDRLIRQNIVWYWGVFKWLGVVLPKIFWQIANRVVAISAIGLIVGTIRKKFKKESIAKISLLSLISVTYVLLIFWHDWRTVQALNRQIGIQARYYFPTLTAHMALLIYGITGFFKKKKYNQIIKKILFLLFISLQLAGIYTIAKSYYDISNLRTLFIQASQYKPIFAKGIVWVGWAGMYLVGLINISHLYFSNDSFSK